MRIKPLRGAPLDRKHPAIAETWRGISRSKARTETKRKAKAIVGSKLSAMLDKVR